MLEWLWPDCNAAQIGILLLGAVLIGINKTGIPGIGTLPVVLLALFFPARLSTGMQLLMLCCGDLIAVSYYRHGANFRIILRMLPCALLGLGLGSLLLRVVPDDPLRELIGWIIAGLSVLSLVKSFCLKTDALPRNFLFSAIFGVLAGFTTQVANAAGPVMAIYLLTLRMDKEEFIRTSVWFFMIVNWIKMPIFISEGRIGLEALRIMAPAIPMIGVGALLGVLFLRKVPQKAFNWVVQILIFLSAIKLIFS